MTRKSMESMVKNSFWHRLINLLSPKACVVCGDRLGLREDVLCPRCNLHLPRTGYASNAYENELAKMFWGKLPVERCAALFFYQSHSPVCNILYDLKYHHHDEIGVSMGQMTADEFALNDFFEGIDVIIPVPLARKKERSRGYNQSMEIARGVSAATGLPVANDIVRRNTYTGSQTQKGHWERLDNVEDAFELIDGDKIHGKHVLLIDDVVTTGATLTSCGKEIVKAGDIKISILALGFTKG
jgi:ComF family protein